MRRQSAPARRALRVSVLGSLALGLGIAGVAHAAGEQCINTRLLETFAAPDTHTVYVRVAVNEVWRLDLMTNCLELPYRLNIGLEGQRGDPWICHPVEATVINHGSGIPHRCPVSAMHKLTPQEIAALPKNAVP